MALPPLLYSRPPAEQILFAYLIPVIFGGIVGFFLGESETLYLLLQIPAILGGFGAGLEHEDRSDAALRGLLGGACFGLAILIAHELTGSEAKAHLPEPAILLAVVTALAGSLLGFLGALLRARLARA